MDIHTASQKVREAYKSYYKLKTLALQDFLMDITFSDDRENNTSLDVSEIKHTASSVESDKLMDQTDQIRLHRIALADIQNGSDVDTSACDNEKKVPVVEEHIKDSIQDQRAADLKEVWGAHLNINSGKASDFGTKTLKQRSSSFHFSEKLFVGSKFNKKNPRKSRSFSRPSKSVENDGFAFPVLCDDKKMSSELSCGSQQDTKLQESESSLKGLLEGKFKVLTNSTPITYEAVSAIHRAVELHEEKLIPSRTVDKGWLQRCAKSNSLDCQVIPVNDSGIESVDSSTIADHCSSTEGTPRLLQSVSGAVPQLVYANSEQHLTCPDIIQNEDGKTTVAASDDSDEDVICNSDESEHEDHTRMRRIACDSKRKLYSVDFVLSEPLAKKQKTCSEEVPEVAAADDMLIEIPSTADIDKIAEAIVSTEKSVGKKKCAASGKLTKKEILEKKMSMGRANDNFVRINIKKKVYVRGKKYNNYSKYKKAEWKKKKKSGSVVDDAVGSSGLLKCFNCGDVGHFARNCLNVQG